MTLDVASFVVIIASAILYFVSKKKTIFIFTGGIGVGMLIGAIWLLFTLQNL